MADENIPPAEAATDTLSFNWRTAIGTPGEDAQPSNPLRRSIDHLFRTGRPFKRLALSFLQASNSFRWFGAFVQGEHLMFFPGFAQQYDSAEIGRDGKPSQHNFKLDHLTLDLRQRRWHVTSTGRQDHKTARRLQELGGGRAFWFGMAFDDPDRMRELFENTSCEFEAPKSDSDRRRRIVQQAREGIEFPVLQVPDNPDFSHSYVHASVIVGPSGFDEYIGADHAFPGNDLLKAPNPTERVQLLTRIYRLSLCDWDLQITLTRLPGQLRMPLVFTAL